MQTAYPTFMLCDRDSDQTLCVMLLVRQDGGIECRGEESPVPDGSVGLLCDVRCGTVTCDRVLLPTSVSVTSCWSPSDREIDVPAWADLASDAVMHRAEAAICCWMEEHDYVFDD